MSQFGAGDLQAVLAECGEQLLGARLQAVQQPRADLVTLELYRGHAYLLLISLHKQHSRLHLTSRRLRNPPTPSGFCMYLRARLQGGILTGLRQINGDRIVALDFDAPQSRQPGRYTLIMEIMGPRSNALLLDDAGRILQSLRHMNSRERDDLIGAAYEPPALNRDLEPAGPPPPGDTWNNHFDHAYLLLEAKADFDDKHEQYQRAYTRHVRKTRKRLEKLRDSLAAAHDHESVSRLGELLKSNFHLLRKGMATVAVVDYYDPEQAEISITLDPRATPTQNVEHYFKRARRMAGARKRLADLCDKTAAELQRLEGMQIDRRLAEAKTMNDLIAVEDRLVATKVLTHPKKKGARAPRRTGFRHFRDEHGRDIYVGRNNNDNDKLTLHTASAHDLWLHVVGFPGSHVVVRLARDEQVAPETLLDAGQLAKYYSKARDHAKAEIHYTLKKYVSKPKGARPGLVTLSRFDTLWIETDPARLDRLRHSVTGDAE